MAAQIIETEETLIIETPERVPLAFPLASIGNRFLAVAIDHTIQYLAIAAVFVGFMLIAGAGQATFGAFDSLDREMPNWVIAVMIFVLFLLFAGYFAVFEWLWDGQTPGKRLLKLRVIREDGRPITLWEAIARNLLRIFDAFPGFLLPISGPPSSAHERICLLAGCSCSTSGTARRCCRTAQSTLRRTSPIVRSR